MPTPSDNLFKWRHYHHGIILLCVRWYLRYLLSYRQLAEMMRERGDFGSRRSGVQISAPRPRLSVYFRAVYVIGSLASLYKTDRLHLRRIRT